MLTILASSETNNLFNWTWAPSVLIGFGLWTIAYIILTRSTRRPDDNEFQPSTWQQISFHTATLVATVALISPLDHLGDDYLFSAHMVQHLLLMFVSAPLWLVGVPGWLLESLVPAWLRRFGHWLTRPLTAYVVFAFTMIGWHIPVFYNLALTHDWVHILEHLNYMAAAVIGWWPIAGPNVDFAPKPVPPLRIVYNFLLLLPFTALAAALTFVEVPLYPFYTIAPRILGLSVMADQQLGGLIMWVPTHMIFLLTISITFFQWFEHLGNAGDTVSAHTST